MKKYTREEIERIVNDVLIDMFDVKKEQINKDAGMYEDLKLDSLDSVELVMEIEKKFDIYMPDEEMTCGMFTKLCFVYDTVEYFVNKRK